MFTNELDAKNAETRSLRAELEALKNSKEVPSQAPLQQRSTYYAVAPKPKAVTSAKKSRKTVEKE